MDVIDKKSDKELIESLIAEVAKASNEIKCAKGDIEKASLRDKVIAAGVLFDKERLERGQSTSNQSMFFHVVAEAPDIIE